MGLTLLGVSTPGAKPWASARRGMAARPTNSKTAIPLERLVMTWLSWSGRRIDRARKTNERAESNAPRSVSQKFQPLKGFQQALTLGAGFQPAGSLPHDHGFAPAAEAVAS